MSGAIGLKNSFGDLIFRPWLNMRGNPNKPGRDVTLESFIQHQAGGSGLTNALGRPLTLKDVWRDFGLNPMVATLENIVSTGDGGKWLAPSVVLDFVMKGAMARPWHLQLCKESVPVGSKTVEVPYIEHQDLQMYETAEAETISQATQRSFEKTVPLKKRAVGIVFTNEFLLGSAIPVIKPFLEEVGYKLAADRNRRAVQTVVNGDGGRDSEGNPVADSCAVIGTATGNSIQFKDFTRAWTRGTALYLNWHTLISSEDTANEILEIEQFSEPKAGSAMVQVDSLGRIVPGQMPHFVSSEVADGDGILVDPGRAMIHAEFMPVFVDTDKIASRQLQGTYASVIDGFVTLKREARVGIRKSLTFAEAGFPSWMEPLD